MTTPAGAAIPRNKYAEWFPLKRSGRQAAYFDPKTQKFTLIDTCFSTHHLQFDNDPDETLYFNELTGPIVGWIDTKIYDQTHDEQKAVGWCGQVVDTNGDGKITKPWNIVPVRRGGEDSVLYDSDTAGGRPTAAAPRAAQTPFDPKLDSLVSYSLYSIIPSPVDDSVWGISELYPGYLIRMQRGNDARRPARRKSSASPSPASTRAASTSTPTAWSGPR